jgi:uncharacterized protein YggE
MDPRENKAVTAIIVFFVCLFLYTKFLGPIPLSVNAVNTQNSDVFQSSGTGSYSAVPDKAQINLGVTESGPSVTQAQNQLNTKMSAVISALKKQGVKDKDIKTTDY